MEHLQASMRNWSMGLQHAQTNLGAAVMLIVFVLGLGSLQQVTENQQVYPVIEFQGQREALPQKGRKSQTKRLSINPQPLQVSALTLSLCLSSVLVHFSLPPSSAPSTHTYTQPHTHWHTHTICCSSGSCLLVGKNICNYATSMEKQKLLKKTIELHLDL